MLARKIDAGFFLLYACLGMLYILIFRSGSGGSFGPPLLEPLVKTLPIWLLALMAIWRLSRHRGGLLLTFGLLFGSAGDFVLSASWIQDKFLIGLALFLVGHVLYALGFLLLFRYRLSRLILLILVGIVVAGLLAVIVPHLKGDLRPFVLAYIFVIFVMNAAAAFRKFNFLGVFAGAVLFLISDSLIALNKFVGMEIAGFWIMASYYLAQFLIIMGSISDAEIDRAVASL